MRIEMSVEDFAKLLKEEGTQKVWVSQNRVNKVRLNKKKEEVLNYILDKYDGYIRTENIPEIARAFEATSQQIAGFCASLREEDKIKYIVKENGYTIYSKMLKYVKEYGKQSIYDLARIFDITPSSVMSTIRMHASPRKEHLFIKKSRKRDEQCRFMHTVYFAE